MRFSREIRSDTTTKAVTFRLISYNFPITAMQTLFQHGIELLNQGSYFHAHDVLEEVWREVRGENRAFYQGVVQVAIAMHHHSKANRAGAQSVLAKAIRNLEPYPSPYVGIDLAGLKQQLGQWSAAMESGGPFPAPVRIEPAAP